MTLAEREAALKEPHVMHKHRCECGFVWEHDDRCGCDVRYHTCRRCQRVVWGMFKEK